VRAPPNPAYASAIREYRTFPCGKIHPFFFFFLPSWEGEGKKNINNFSGSRLLLHILVDGMIILFIYLFLLCP